MAVIDQYLQQILEATYGEEVRHSIHDSIKQNYIDITESVDRANAAAAAANQAAQNASAAVDTANQATAAANQATQNVNAVVDTANQAASTANTASQRATDAADLVEEIKQDYENATAEATSVQPGGAPTATLIDGPDGKKFVFGIPAGTTPQIGIGTVSTGVAGSNAEVNISGSADAPMLNFTIPRGDTGLPTDAQTTQAVSDWLDAHPEATTTVQDHSLTVDKLAIGTLGYITPQMYGAKGDGVTDDSAAIVEAISHLTDNSTLVFPNSVYLCSAPSEWGSIIRIKDLENVVIDLGGCTIEIAPNGYQGYSIIDVVDCKNFTIKNGNLVGDRLNHDYTTTGGKHEWCYGIQVRTAKTSLVSNGCYGKICDLNISQMPGDGITLFPSYAQGTILIDNCDISYCRRQGISLLQGDEYIITNTNISHIGDSDGIDGVAPKTGIDIEPTSGTSIIHNIKLENINISDTTSYAIIMGHGYYMDGVLELINVTTKNGVSFGNDSENNILATIIIKDCEFSAASTQLILAGNVTLYNSKLYNAWGYITATCYSCLIESNGANLTGIMISDSIIKNAKLFRNNTSERNWFINNTFVNCTLFGWITNFYMNCYFYGTLTAENLSARQTLVNCYLENGKPASAQITVIGCYDKDGNSLT